MKQTIYKGHVYNVCLRVSNLLLLSRVAHIFHDGFSTTDIYVNIEDVSILI